ncbi:MAG: alpha-galactosidase, partial [Candidatus Aminicenantes bacterium]|nr:alpha-galactosidase [Candidatus Aminicenantes bacterium]
MKKIKMLMYFVMFCLFLAVNTATSAAPAINPEEPPNQPGKITVKADQIVWEYEGKPLFKAEILTDIDKYRMNTAADSSDGRTTQLLILTAKRWRDSIEVRGTIHAGLESFPCEADRRDSGLRIVRHSHGLSNSLLNRAVYDRSRDWVFSVDHNPQVKITPSKEDKLGRSYAVEISGREIVIRFRPRYYQKHRGLKYFEPWTYKVWPKPVVGWCSWFAYFQDINEQNIKKVADVMAEVLLPYGYEYLQIDDGFQRGHGLPELWLEPNEKFPRGLKDLADYIKSRGLKPGIWTNVAFNQMDYAEKNRALFVLDSQGRPARGNWIDISIDGSNPEAVNRLVRPVYKGLKQMGWQYFKVDALRHLRYEGYNSQPEYFRKKGVDRVEAYRTLVKAIRDEVGQEHFMLGCWGIRPELIGIIDGCRIGTDGYSFAGLSQYNSFNNIVWLNDPDHIELSPEEAFRSTMATSLTGSLFLLTDKPEVYLTPIVEPAKRAAPVLFTYPGQVFDVDPSR